MNNTPHSHPADQVKVEFPAINVVESTSEYCIRIAVPGYNRKSLKIHVHEDVLTFEGDSFDHAADLVTHKQEFNFHSFKRSILLPQDINALQIDASYTDGLISVHVPKSTHPVHCDKDISLN